MVNNISGQPPQTIRPFKPAELKKTTPRQVSTGDENGNKRQGQDAGSGDDGLVLLSGLGGGPMPMIGYASTDDFSQQLVQSILDQTAKVEKNPECFSADR